MHRRGHQPWCQPHQLVRMQLQHPALPARYRPRQQLRYPAQDQELHCRYIGGVRFRTPRGLNPLL